MRLKKVNKLLERASIGSLQNLLEFAKQPPPHPENIRDKDLEADMFLKSLDMKIARIHVYRFLEPTKDEETTYTFTISSHDTSKTPKIVNLGTFTQDEMLETIKHCLQQLKNQDYPQSIE